MKKKDMFVYSVFGINIIMNINCENLSQYLVNDEDASILVKVIHCEKKNMIKGEGHSSNYTQFGTSPNAYFKNNRIIIDFENICTINMSFIKKTYIKVYKYANTDDEIIKEIIIHDIIPLALIKNGFLVLHAGCMIIENKGILFLGDSGTGKSTMVGELFKRGYNLISDDMIAIISSEKPNLYVLGYLSQISLWNKSSDFLKLNNGYNENSLKFYKKIYKIKNDKNKICEINKIFLINRINEEGYFKPKIRIMNKVTSYIFLIKSLIMGYAIDKEEMKIIQNELKKIVDKNDVFILDYPNGLDYFNRVVDDIIEIIKNSEEL